MEPAEYWLGTLENYLSTLPVPRRGNAAPGALVFLFSLGVLWESPFSLDPLLHFAVSVCLP